MVMNHTQTFLSRISNIHKYQHLPSPINSAPPPNKVLLGLGKEGAQGLLRDQAALFFQYHAPQNAHPLAALGGLQ